MCGLNIGRSHGVDGADIDMMWEDKYRAVWKRAMVEEEGVWGIGV